MKKAFQIYFSHLTFLLAVTATFGQNYVVTNNNDSGTGSLREAINMANTDGVPSNISFLEDYTINLITGEMVINSDIVIVGNGIGSTVLDGSSNIGQRAIRAFSMSSISISGITFLNFTSTDEAGAVRISNVDNSLISNCSFLSNSTSSSNGGGAIFNSGGNLEIEMSEFNFNVSSGSTGSGGALLSSGGDVVIRGSEFDSNSANATGGAIDFGGGTLTIMNSIVSNNDVNGTVGTPNPGDGGGIHTSQGNILVLLSETIVFGNKAARNGGGLYTQSSTDMNLSQTVVDNNEAFGSGNTRGGGGIYNNGGTMEILTSTISNNSASGAEGKGGGIYNDGISFITMSRSTISGNVANLAGGGVFNESSFIVNATTIAMNEAGTTGGGIESGVTPSTLKNTIVANNVALSGVDVSGAFTSQDYNLIGIDDLDDFPDMPNDNVGVDPLLAPLQDNGGFTFTHALLNGSVAYNGGDPNDQFNDQREETVFDGVRDIGSFEIQTILNISENAEESNGIIIYPNPSQGRTNMFVPLDFGNHMDLLIIEAGSGKIIQKSVASIGNNELILNKVVAGIYILQITSEKKSAIVKLVITN